jgi:hypothetical protein
VPKARRSRRSTDRIIVPLEKDTVGVARWLLTGLWICLRSLFGTLFGWALVVATLLGLIALAPNVSLQPPSEGADPLEPFHAPFVISNQSTIPIYSVSATCALPGIGANEIPPEAPSAEHPVIVKAFMKVPVFSAPRLTQDSKTFQCDNFRSITMNGRPIPVRSCKVTIQVKMRILHIIPWSLQSEFVGELGKDNLIHWKFAPMQEETTKGS